MLDCVIPAAGASTRMGTLKPLLPYAGSTLVETAVDAALEAETRVILVVGHLGAAVSALFAADAYRAAREAGRMLIVDNRRWEEGLLGSIQAGLPSVKAGAFFISHADMPFIAPAAYRALASAMVAREEEGTAAKAFIASHDGARGHPVLLPCVWIPEMLALDPRGALRDFVALRATVLVETGPGALRDIDTLGDYEEARTRALLKRGAL